MYPSPLHWALKAQDRKKLLWLRRELGAQRS